MEAKHVEKLELELKTRFGEALADVLDEITGILEYNAEENRADENAVLKSKVTIPVKMILEYNSQFGITGKVVIDAKRVEKVSGVAEFELPFIQQEELPLKGGTQEGN